MDFIIEKVNGKDVSGLKHEDAWRVFQEAVEPIMVEVRRRKPSSPGKKPPEVKKEPKHATQCTQTDVTLVGCDWVDDWRPEGECDSPESDYMFPGDLPQSLSQYLEPEIDIEEIVIDLQSHEESLGLTLYYTRSPTTKQQNDQQPTSVNKIDKIEVLVSQIEPDSAAARDGRIRIGDQILQINGEEIISQDQTEKLFKNGNRKTSLVVSRTQCYDEDDLEEGEIVDEIVQDEDNALLSANSEFTSTCFKPNDGSTSKFNLEKTIEESDEPISLSQSSTSENITVNDRSLEKPKLDINSIDSKTSSTSSSPTWSSKFITPPVVPAFSHIQKETPASIKGRPLLPPPSCYDSEHIYESIPSNSESEEPIYCLPYESRFEVPLIKRVGRNSGSSSSSAGSSRSSKNKNLQQKSWVKDSHSVCVEERDSSSAYNTGDSNESKQATIEASFGIDPELSQSTLSLLPPRETKEDRKNKKETCENCRKLDLRPIIPRKQDSIESRKHVVKNDANTFVPCVSAQTVYTNSANLGETIWLQQQLFRHALVKREQSKIGRDTEKEPVKSPSKIKNESHEKQWRVKIRPDGTRYITHRPARKKIMKERELRIIEERNGLTTDDDTKSELKRGRYWPREERKKHIEKERERKRIIEIRRQTRIANNAPINDIQDSTKRWTQLNIKPNCYTTAAIPSRPPNNILFKRTIPQNLMSPHLPYVPVQPRLPSPPKGLLSVTTV